MTSSSFYEEGSKLLTPGAFEFVLDSELKRAVRSQNFLTLVTLEASREWEGMMVTADDGTVHEVAEIIGKEVRDTDLIGHTDKLKARISGDRLGHDAANQGLFLLRIDLRLRRCEDDVQEDFALLFDFLQLAHFEVGVAGTPPVLRLRGRGKRQHHENEE